ncbi:glutamate ligase domain-containing protein [Streptomyces sp. AB3(2024)]|uniref:glutamate ligase domain-containing protein n=1 Tax=Streptomyces sp. AB3(2024) TaxID=3317321 RepID=UPI0035A2C696
MEVLDRRDGLRIVNDAFNANPESMAVALSALSAMAGGRRTVAVLGEMKELGEEAIWPTVSLRRRVSADTAVGVTVIR